jgi:hypothetical protein
LNVWCTPLVRIACFKFSTPGPYLLKLCSKAAANARLPEHFGNTYAAAGIGISNGRYVYVNLVPRALRVPTLVGSVRSPFANIQRLPVVSLDTENWVTLSQPSEIDKDPLQA